MRLFWFVVFVAASLSVLVARLMDALLQERIAIFGDVIGLQYGLNPGIAWGIRLPSGIQEIAIAVALVGVVVLAYRESGKWQVASGKSLPTPYPLLPGIAYGFIVGGGLGNIIDRFPDGVVTDFFQIGTFPVFNVADSFVTVGVVILLFLSLKKEKSGGS